VEALEQGGKVGGGAFDEIAGQELDAEGAEFRDVPLLGGVPGSD
jgi:hypothetical protein